MDQKKQYFPPMIQETILESFQSFLGGLIINALVMLRWDEDAFWRMIYSSPSLIRQILHSMAKLLQTLETGLQHNQKLIALGGLAAGLAHELNNPAAAANRTITQLSDSIQEWRSLVRKLNVQHGMTAQQWSYVSEVRNDTLKFDS